MCAFDMLATLAGKILTEGENSLLLSDANPMAMKETANPEAMKSDPLDQDSCNENEAPLKEVTEPPNLYSRRDLGLKPPPLVSSDSSTAMPSDRDDIKIAWTRVVDRECEDNSSACTHSSTFGNHSTFSKKVLSTKYRKTVSPHIHKGDKNYSGMSYHCCLLPFSPNLSAFSLLLV
jgi:hypothetical protein